MEQKLVVIESPFAASADYTVDDHIAFARACVRHSLMLMECPIASHLLHTQPGILRDEVDEERLMGIRAGHAWIPRADIVAVYGDLGISNGMKAGIEKAQRHKIKVEYRNLHPWSS